MSFPLRLVVQVGVKVILKHDIQHRILRDHLVGKVHTETPKRLKLLESHPRSGYVHFYQHTHSAVGGRVVEGKFVIVFRTEFVLSWVHVLGEKGADGGVFIHTAVDESNVCLVKYPLDVPPIRK